MLAARSLSEWSESAAEIQQGRGILEKEILAYIALMSS